jgi:hypothetical protein
MFAFFTKEAILTRRSTVLSLPLQLVVPGLSPEIGSLEKLENLKLFSFSKLENKTLSSDKE